MMTPQAKAVPWRDRILQQETLNFWLTNRLPRAALTIAMGRISPIRSRLVRWPAIALWKWFARPDLSDARKTRFDSLHDAFIRELRPGARAIEPDRALLASPCDAIVGECGRVQAGQLWQAKGSGYTLADLFGDASDASPWLEGCYATLRLTAGMYHRFHAPHDATLEQVTYLSGDTWNVNPVALKRVPRLYCRNERAVLKLRLADDGAPLALVPVAAILVASIRLHALDLLMHIRYPGPNRIDCHEPVGKGDELGWFQHGSTIIVFAPPGYALVPGIETGARIRMGQALMRRPDLPLAATRDAAGVEGDVGDDG